MVVSLIGAVGMTAEEIAAAGGLDPNDGVPIGHGVFIEGFFEDDAGQIIGLVETHPNGKGGRCAGAVNFDTPAAHAAFANGVFWTVESWEPMTLAPSVLCRSCGHHGWIRNGRWVPA